MSNPVKEAEVLALSHHDTTAIKRPAPKRSVEDVLRCHAVSILPHHKGGAWITNHDESGAHAAHGALKQAGHTVGAVQRLAADRFRFRVGGAKLESVSEAVQATTLTSPHDKSVHPAEMVDGEAKHTHNSEGRLIHPTAEGRANFHRWSGGTHIADKHGRPLVMYHGTDANFDAFKDTAASHGVHFLTPNAGYGHVQKSASVKPVYAKAKSVHHTDYQQHIEGLHVWPEHVKELKDKGHDAVVYSKKGDITKGSSGWGDDYAQVAVFHPRQIKSATGNTGAFSAGSDHIGESSDRGPASDADKRKIAEIISNPDMPERAEKGKAYVVHWADGRGVWASKTKSGLSKWLEKTGSWAEIVSIQYREPTWGKEGKKIRTVEGILTTAEVYSAAQRAKQALVREWELCLMGALRQSGVPTYVAESALGAGHFRNAKGHFKSLNSKGGGRWHPNIPKEFKKTCEALGAKVKSAGTGGGLVLVFEDMGKCSAAHAKLAEAGIRCTKHDLPGILYVQALIEGLHVHVAHNGSAWKHDDLAAKHRGQYVGRESGHFVYRFLHPQQALDFHKAVTGSGDKASIQEAAKTSSLAEYPLADPKNSALTVREHVPNTASIASTFDHYKVLPGIRHVPISHFPSHSANDLFYAANDHKRVKELAGKIKESGEINPLIVAVDHEGPYVLEGAHRLAALHHLGETHVPAMVVHDHDSVTEAVDAFIDQTGDSLDSSEKSQDGAEHPCSCGGTGRNKHRIPGRKADTRPDDKYDAKALAAGVKVESEHTKDVAVQKTIAKDHLDEDPHYYTKLLKFVESVSTTLTSPHDKSVHPAEMVDGEAKHTHNSEGKLIHPTAEGRANFHKWFAGSKVTDEHGRPKVLYHGTAGDFSKFKHSSGGNLGPGIYVSQDASDASEYAGTHGKDGSNVKAVYARITNPVHVRTANTSSEDLFKKFPAKDDAGTIQAAKDAGHDAIMVHGVESGKFGKTSREINVFHPHQIKSATGNTGAFSAGSDHIGESALTECGVEEDFSEVLSTEQNARCYASDRAQDREHPHAAVKKKSKDTGAFYYVVLPIEDATDAEEAGEGEIVGSYGSDGKTLSEGVRKRHKLISKIHSQLSKGRPMSGLRLRKARTAARWRARNRGRYNLQARTSIDREPITSHLSKD